jgi:hypothetical protein
VSSPGPGPANAADGQPHAHFKDLYKHGRMTWTEPGNGWIGRPEAVLGALATDGFHEFRREMAARPKGRRVTEGAWGGVNLQTRSVASVTSTARRAPEPPGADKEPAMLWTIAVILLVLWALGMITAYSAGGLLHLLLVVAVIMVVFQFLGGRRSV